MDAVVPNPKIIVRTILEKDLGELLDHVADWGYVKELEIASMQGEWVVCLTPAPDDPRTDRFLAYVSERPEIWRIGASDSGSEPQADSPTAEPVEVPPLNSSALPLAPPVL